MYVAIDIDRFDVNNIFIGDKIPNTIIENSHFINMVYSDTNANFKSIVLRCPFTLFPSDYSNYRYRINTNNHKNQSIMSQLLVIERNILAKFENCGIPKYGLAEQYSANNVCAYVGKDLRDANTRTCVVKISGVWVNETHYGLTFKFIR